MSKLFIILFFILFFSVLAKSQVRHDPCSVKKVDGKIVFDCGHTKTEINIEDIKGQKGDKGEKGDMGQGGNGENIKTIKMKYCKHMPNHLNRTMNISVFGVVTGHLGFYGQNDHSGECLSHEEGKCTCDRCYNNNFASDKIYFYHKDGE